MRLDRDLDGVAALTADDLSAAVQSKDNGGRGRWPRPPLSIGTVDYGSVVASKIANSFTAPGALARDVLPSGNT